MDWGFLGRVGTAIATGGVSELGGLVGDKDTRIAVAIATGGQSEWGGLLF